MACKSSDKNRAVFFATPLTMTHLHKFTHFIKSLGLTEYESRIVVVLFKRKEATAKELFEFTAIPITKIYQVLKILEEKGFLESYSSQPKKFKGMEAKKVFEKLLKEKEKSFENILMTIETYLKELVELKLQRFVPLRKIHPVLDAKRV